MTHSPKVAPTTGVVRTTVAQWIAEDPDETTREELAGLLALHEAGDPAATAALTEAFSGPLTFGSAGMRGRLGPGLGRMNRAVVIRATAGLCAYLHQEVGDGFVVVIGYDARHCSDVFARDAAAVVTGAGGRALLMDSHCPTPLLAFSLRALGADAGIMVTASHNPAQDSGFKVYLGGRAAGDWDRGAQIAPPQDAAISEAITALGSLESIPRAESGWELIGPELREEYIERVVTAARTSAAADLRIVLSAMHGVGGRICLEALRRAGFDDVVVVPEQFEPDPGFPTVDIPNPEEAGTMDLLLGLARQERADLAIALDPDADRCSVAVPDETVPGGWRQLTGDAVGILLGEQAAELAAFTGAGVLASSIASGRMLRKIAQDHGLAHRITPTGFTWISRVPGLVFGYEEAMGYCVDPASVRDKDGIAAAVRMALLSSVLKAQGRSLVSLLDRLAQRHGLHLTCQMSARADDAEIIDGIMRRLREGGAPAKLAGSPVVDVFDLMDGASDGNGAQLPPADGIIIKTAADDRVVLRPSSTERKLKCYCEVVMDIPDGEPISAIRAAAAERLEVIKDDLRGALGIPA
ncbi:phosphomannomutase [Actinomyces denticolens]|uniref:Phosphomannomutase n=1 Tax=Actinomyces denticolens TaxID=52767 RepID=A0ABY1I113_9ACTO|nr:phospho-sugar mutase [Actinomyces denticolens]SHI41664.1 phosphomannomutase [Actinomyces denticolens]